MADDQMRMHERSLRAARSLRRPEIYSVPETERIERHAEKDRERRLRDIERFISNSLERKNDSLRLSPIGWRWNKASQEELWERRHHRRKKLSAIRQSSLDLSVPRTARGSSPGRSSFSPRPSKLPPLTDSAPESPSPEDPFSEARAALDLLHKSASTDIEDVFASGEGRALNEAEHCEQIIQEFLRKAMRIYEKELKKHQALLDRTDEADNRRKSRSLYSIETELRAEYSNLVDAFQEARADHARLADLRKEYGALLKQKATAVDESDTHIAELEKETKIVQAENAILALRVADEDDCISDDETHQLRSCIAQSNDEYARLQEQIRLQQLANVKLRKQKDAEREERHEQRRLRARNKYVTDVMARLARRPQLVRATQNERDNAEGELNMLRDSANKSYALDMADVLICKHCRQRFHLPSIISPCGHTFCRPCVESLQATHGKSYCWECTDLSPAETEVLMNVPVDSVCARMMVKDSDPLMSSVKILQAISQTEQRISDVRPLLEALCNFKEPLPDNGTWVFW